ncbi:MFS general substrate transporter [Microthyrium microscopicum]|uniref:MFS general substrate transporter n=1 Tax=Microthyrium microscopicum TaxID=703497 RepID=A0A6A6UA66_9PEZI|nr:MFS general substrate transporter [Microthyrium microscopicum]
MADRAGRPSMGSAELFRRKSSTLHYQTFPNVKPPVSRGRPNNSSRSSASRLDRQSLNASPDMTNNHNESPLPIRQLAILAFIALAEQTAFNSISPYLPEMTRSFPGVKDGQEGLYVGLIASAFALAQFVTNFLWGWLSDRIGRKPVIIFGTIMTAICFALFGFCTKLWQAVLIQVILGLANGNQGLVSTCLGEITDRSNQSKAFTYLPVLYGLGGITGPALGGLLVLENNPFGEGPNPYPYALPNLVSALILFIDVICIMIFLEESLDGAQDLPPLGARVGHFFTWLWQFISFSTRPTYLKRKSRSSRSGNETDSGDDNDAPSMLPIIGDGTVLSRKDVFTRDTILLLAAFLIFQLSNVAYNSLYPIFGEAEPPTGRSLSTKEIGLSIAFAGVLTIVFQIFFYGRIRERIGNRASFRLSHGLFVLAFLIMPFVGYLDKTGFEQGKRWVWVQLGASLLLKTVATVGGLTSALLMITNSAPNHAVLGRLNGLAQTLSAAGRAVGPFLSGSIFSAATHIQPKGEALAFGLFAGIAFIGFLISFGIQSEDLEAEDWEGEPTDDLENRPLLHSDNSDS